MILAGAAAKGRSSEVPRARARGDGCPCDFSEVAFGAIPDGPPGAKVRPVSLCLSARVELAHPGGPPSWRSSDTRCHKREPPWFLAVTGCWDVHKTQWRPPNRVVSHAARRTEPGRRGASWSPRLPRNVAQGLPPNVAGAARRPVKWMRCSLSGASVEPPRQLPTMRHIAQLRR